MTAGAASGLFGADLGGMACKEVYLLKGFTDSGVILTSCCFKMADVMFLNQVPANTDSVMCFGPLVPDGYAICYNPQADHVHFSITAFNCCEETNAEKLAVTLKDTLCRLQELLQPTV